MFWPSAVVSLGATFAELAHAVGMATEGAIEVRFDARDSGGWVVFGGEKFGTEGQALTTVVEGDANDGNSGAFGNVPEPALPPGYFFAGAFGREREHQLLAFMERLNGAVDEIVRVVALDGDAADGAQEHTGRTTKHRVFDHEFDIDVERPFPHQQNREIEIRCVRCNDRNKFFRVGKRAVELPADKTYDCQANALQNRVTGLRHERTESPADERLCCGFQRRWILFGQLGCERGLWDDGTEAA